MISRSTTSLGRTLLGDKALQCGHSFCLLLSWPLRRGQLGGSGIPPPPAPGFRERRAPSFIILRFERSPGLPHSSVQLLYTRCNRFFWEADEAVLLGNLSWMGLIFRWQLFLRWVADENSQEMRLWVSILKSDLSALQRLLDTHLIHLHT